MSDSSAYSMGSEEREGRFGSADIVQKFYVVVPPVKYSRQILYIPRAFIKKLSEKLPKKIELFVRNGDIYEVRFNTHCQCLVGVQLLFERYYIKTSYYMFFEYWGGGKFGVLVTNTACIEIDYPVRALYHSFSKPMLPTISVSPPFIDNSGSTMEDQLNCSLFNISSFAGCIESFELSIDSIDMLSSVDGVMIPCKYNWVNQYFRDGKTIVLVCNDREWIVMVRKRAEGIYLSNGWHVFATQTGLSCGDLLVIQKTASDYKFSTGIYVDFYNSLRVRREVAMPAIFIRVIDDECIYRAQLMLPLVFWKLYLNTIPPKITILIGSGATYEADYDHRTGVLTGLASLMTIAFGSKSNLWVFNYAGEGVFKLTMYNTKAVDIFMRLSGGI